MNLLNGRFQNKQLLVNALSLYAVQGCTYLLPLLTFPYLSRVLRPEGWGAVLFAQAIGTLIAILVEYGFDFSATRETARYAKDPARLRELVAGVLGAKVFLAAIGLTAAIVTRPFTHQIASSPVLFWSSAFWGVAQGINMLWYFQGLQRMTWAGGLDITGKIVSTLSIFIMVRSPEDGWKVMAAQAAGAAVSHAITVVIAYSEVGFCWPTASRIREALRLGWAMFLFRASQTLLTSANGIILGFAASPAALALFVGADKIRQVANQALWPISQTLFPHQSQQIRENLVTGSRTVRRSIYAIGGLSALIGLALIVGAPLLVKIALGPAFVDAVPVVRVFGMLIPLSAVCTVIGFQWMLPLDLDRQFNFVILTSGLLNVLLGIVLAYRFGVVGMAVSLTVAQAYTLIAFRVVLRRQRLDPLGDVSAAVYLRPAAAAALD
jgi:PST family polysaccharide transporter